MTAGVGREQQSEVVETDELAFALFARQVRAGFHWTGVLALFPSTERPDSCSPNNVKTLLQLSQLRLSGQAEELPLEAPVCLRPARCAEHLGGS